MKNWKQRLTIFAIVGAVITSALLVGCGSKSDDTTAAAPNAAGNTAAPATNDAE